MMDPITLRLVVVSLVVLGAYALYEGEVAQFALVVVTLAGLLPGARTSTT